MSEHSDRMVELREHIDVSYDGEQVARGLFGLERRIRRRRVAKRVAGALAVLAFAFFTLRGPGRTMELRTEDGSVATRLSPETELAVERQSPELVELALARGRGHFEVTRNPKRKYRVRAGLVTVEVLGTAFDVNRVADATEVHVDHGLVRVRWSAGEQLLGAGEGGVFPPPAEPPELVPSTALAEPAQVAEPMPEDSIASPGAVAVQLAPAPEPARTRSKRGKHSEREALDQGWRVLARAGKHREAIESLGTQPVEDLEGLLLAADAARLSARPREAAQHLEHLVRKYPESAPARLAAFTLARLQLNELDDPARAAASFARAYALDPSGPLAEDALAREAEAYRLAGNPRRAADAAARYLARFPHGSRRSEMSAYRAP